MQKILLVGAGRSSTSLINYLLDHSEKENWQLTIAERNIALAKEKINGHPRARTVSFDASDDSQLTTIVKENDLIISMLPSFLQ